MFDSIFTFGQPKREASERTAQEVAPVLIDPFAAITAKLAEREAADAAAQAIAQFRVDTITECAVWLIENGLRLNDLGLTFVIPENARTDHVTLTNPKKPGYPAYNTINIAFGWYSVTARHPGVSFTYFEWPYDMLVARLMSPEQAARFLLAQAFEAVA